MAHKDKKMTNEGRVICPRTSNAQIQYAVVSDVSIFKGHRAK